MMRSKYLFYTDPHLTPWTRKRMVSSILQEDPQGVFITGDICYGPTLEKDLTALAETGKDIDFVLGNHDYHGSSLQEVHRKVRLLTSKYKNLIWMTDVSYIPINDEVAVIGTEGWYDAIIGDPKYLTYTMDWPLISEFKKLDNMKQRIEAFRDLATHSARLMEKRLELAVEQYKTVYLLTHFPPWKEANRRRGLIGEEFWEPYNCNITLGNKLEKVMSNHKKRHLIVLCGHTHCPISIHVSRNIECRVGRGAYHKLSGDEIIFI